MNKLRNSLVIAVLALTLSVIGLGRAGAVVIDFEALEHAGSGQQALPGTGKFYTEKGFNFDSSAPLFNFATWGTNSSNYFGSTALWNGDGTGTTGITTLTRAGGGAFDLDSIDIAELNATLGGSASVTFEAVLSGGGTISTSFTTDGFRTTGDLTSFQTLNFSGFDDIVSVSWLQVTPFIQFDNVVIDGATEVSEPGALATFMAGLTLLGLISVARRTETSRIQRQ